MHQLYCDDFLIKLKIELSATTVKDKLLGRNGDLSTFKFDEYKSSRSNDESIVLITTSSMRDGWTEPFMSIERSSQTKASTNIIESLQRCITEARQLNIDTKVLVCDRAKTWLLLNLWTCQFCFVSSVLRPTQLNGFLGAPSWNIRKKFIVWRLRQEKNMMIYQIVSKTLWQWHRSIVIEINQNFFRRNWDRKRMWWRMGTRNKFSGSQAFWIFLRCVSVSSVSRNTGRN